MSFEEHGQQVTVPVKDNIWTYQTQVPDALYDPMVSLTAHFADGSTAVQTHKELQRSDSPAEQT